MGICQSSAVESESQINLKVQCDKSKYSHRHNNQHTHIRNRASNEENVVSDKMKAEKAVEGSSQLKEFDPQSSLQEERYLESIFGNSSVNDESLLSVSDGYVSNVAGTDKASIDQELSALYLVKVRNMIYHRQMDLFEKKWNLT